MAKKLKSQQSASNGDCCYIDNLPDELVILIFTKLSSTSSPCSQGNLDDIKSLGKCSIVSKKFSSLACQVPTLCIIHPSIITLYECCPEILTTFKHIRSLQVLHCSSSDLHFNSEHNDLPTIRWEAAYRPHSYCLAVVLSEKGSYYPNKDVRESLMHSVDAAEVRLDLCKSFTAYIIYLICHHHMLVSSIKDHKYLQKVVVSDYSNTGTFTLEEHMLVELRNCSSTTLEQVQARHRFAFSTNLDSPNPSENHSSGVVLKNTCFSIVEWCEKASDEAFLREDDDVDREIPGCLRFKGLPGLLLMGHLQSLLEKTAYLQVNDDRAILEILSHIKAHGNLL